MFMKTTKILKIRVFYAHDDDVKEKEYQVFYHFHKTKVKTDRFIKVYYQNIKIEFGVYFSKQKAF